MNCGVQLPWLQSKITKYLLDQTRSAPLCGAGNFGKLWSACGQREIQYAEWRLSKYKYNFTCVFLCTSCALEIYDTGNYRKNNKKIKFTAQARVSTF